MRLRINVEPPPRQSRCVRVAGSLLSDQYILQRLSFSWAVLPQVTGSFRGFEHTCHLVTYNYAVRTVTCKHKRYSSDATLLIFVLSNKAVADGAIAFYLDHSVSSRVARWTYGIECLQYYDISNPQHLLRSATTVIWPSGVKMVPNGFSPILVKVSFNNDERRLSFDPVIKGTQVSEAKEFTRSYLRERRNVTDYESNESDIICYRGTSPDPQWMDTERSV